MAQKRSFGTLKMLMFGLAGITAGCGGVDGIDESSVGKTIVNGVAYTLTDRLVLLNSLGCTGTMITNDWVLTASHCFGSLPTPSSVTATLNGTTKTGLRYVRHPSLDYALLQLSSPMTINGSTSGHKSFMYTHSASSLIGQNFQLQGFGVSTLADCMAGGGASFGTMRYAGLDAVNFDQYNIQYNDSSGNNWASGPGDSGAPYWKFFNGNPYQVGIQKSGNCTTASFAANPEAFNQWVFEVVYNAPIHVPTVNAANQGLWFIGGAFPQFWDRPLLNSKNLTAPAFDSCSGLSGTNRYAYSVNFENGYDFFNIQDSVSTINLTGNGGGVANGRSGAITLSYTTDSSVQSPGVNWMTVQCDWNSSDAGQLVCHGSRCATTRDPLQNNWSQSVSWNPCGGGDFWYYAEYDMEANFDFVTINGNSHTGNGTANGIYVAGPTTVSVSTDSSVQSAGLRSLRAVCNGW